MRRDELYRTMKRIKLVTPWLRWHRCDECATDFKNRTPWGKEKMWKIAGIMTGAHAPCEAWTVWGCMACFSDEGAVLKKYATSGMHRQYTNRNKAAGPLDFK